jgi:hypothetical protein
MLSGVRWEGRRPLLHGCEKVAGRTGTFGPDSSLPRIFLSREFGSVCATMSGNGSGPAIRAIYADPRSRLAPRVASVAWSLEHLIRGVDPV